MESFRLNTRSRILVSNRILEGRLHKVADMSDPELGSARFCWAGAIRMSQRGPGGNGRVRVDRASAGCGSGFGEQEDQLIVIDRLDQVMIKPSLL
jgi:hypothetical protein